MYNSCSEKTRDWRNERRGEGAKNWESSVSQNEKKETGQPEEDVAEDVSREESPPPTVLRQWINRQQRKGRRRRQNSQFDLRNILSRPKQGREAATHDREGERRDTERKGRNNGRRISRRVEAHRRHQQASASNNSAKRGGRRGGPLLSPRERGGRRGRNPLGKRIYHESAKAVSYAYKHRPQTALETTWWVEYVAAIEGASLLKSHSVHLSRFT
ncbi:hypothetical protein GQX74_009473 [Glossina fuscipes]|nr:hypothetical protein GQX74_009473 [Glossina fuscipes]